MELYTRIRTSVTQVQWKGSCKALVAWWVSLVQVGGSIYCSYTTHRWAAGQGLWVWPNKWLDVENSLNSTPIWMAEKGNNGWSRQYYRSNTSTRTHTRTHACTHAHTHSTVWASNIYTLLHTTTVQDWSNLLYVHLWCSAVITHALNIETVLYTHIITHALNIETVSL